MPSGVGRAGRSQVSGHFPWPGRPHPLPDRVPGTQPHLKGAVPGVTRVLWKDRIIRLGPVLNGLASCRGTCLSCGAIRTTSSQRAGCVGMATGWKGLH